MTSEVADIVVVGNGMFGSAATRHLAERGHDVINVGAPGGGATGDEKSGPAAPAAHRVHSSHDDAARLTRLQDRDAHWAAVTRRAVAGYRELEERSGVSFFHDVGCLIVSRPGGDGTNPDPRRVMDETGVVYRLHEPGDRSWREQWPQLDFPDTHYVVHEPSPAGYIRPKRLIEAQNVLARRAGARFLTDTVVGVGAHSGGHEVVTATGAVVRAAKIVVAGGAFVNANGLLPAPVEVRLKTEVVVLGEVRSRDAAALADTPTVKYLVDGDDLEGIYMVPPVRYEDGRHYVKLGANTRLDRTLHDLGDLQAWFATDTDPDHLPLLEPALRALWPGLEFVTVRTRPCVITYSAARRPLIERVGHGHYVATAGNGGGAKGSDAWGELIADLVEADDHTG